MSFTDSADPSQPLTLNQPQRDLQQYRRANTAPRDQPRMEPRTLPPQVYNPIQDVRPPDQWAQPDWRITAATMNPGMPSGPDVPSGLEVYPTFANYGGRLARWGSDNVSESAGRLSSMAMAVSPILDMLSKGFSGPRSTLDRLKVQQQQMINEAETVLHKHSMEMLDYADIFAKYNAINLDPDIPKDVKLRAMNEARENLRYIADVKYGHRALVSVIDSQGGLDAAERMLNNEDAYYRNILAANTSLKKVTGADEDAETLTGWGESPRAARTASGAGRGIFGPTATESADEAETPSRPSETPTGNDFNSRLARGMNLTPQEMRAVDESVAQGKPSASLADLEKGKATPGKDLVRRKITQGIDAKNAEIDRIADDKNLTPDQKISEVGKVNSNVAGDIAGLADYRLNPREEGVANRQRLAQLTGKIYNGKGGTPAYNQANFTNANKFYDTGSVENKVIVRTNDLVQNWKTLLQSLKPIGENKSIPREQLEAWLAGHGTGDPEYDQVFSQIRNIATQINSIQTLTGTPRVTMVHDLVTNLSKDASPRSIRAQLLPDLQDAFSIVNSYQNQWEGFGKKNLMPGMSPDVFRDYRAIVRMNPYTGQVPDDASNELKSVGLRPEQASSRLTPSQRLPPLSIQAISQMKSKIALWQHSSDPALRQKAQDYIDRIGPVSNIDRRIPGVDEDINAPAK